MSPGLIALLSGLVFVTSIVGVVTGGNSLVNVPVMILAGLEPRTAVATNMFALTFMTFSATARFARDRLVSWRLALPLCVLTLVTSAAGAQLTVVLPERTVKTIVAVSMVAMMVILAARPRFGQAARETTPLGRAAGYVLAAVLGIYGGLFSGGYTTLLTFVSVGCFGITLLEAVGLTKLVNLVSCASATVVFFVGGLVDLRVGAPMAAAMLAGGWVGAHLATRGGDRFVRVVFLVTLGALALKLLVFDILRD